MSIRRFIAKPRGAVVAVAAAAALGAVAAYAIVFVPGSDEQDGGIAEPGGFDAASAPEQPQPQGQTSSDTGEPDSGAQQQHTDTDRGDSFASEQPRQSSDGADTEAAADGETDAASPTGPDHWQAQPDDVDEQQLEQILEEGRERQQTDEALRRDRRRGNSLVQQTVDDCAHDHRLGDTDDRWDHHQLALEWTMTTENGTGTIESPRVLLRRGVGEEQFEQCVLNAVGELEFDASSDGEQLTARQVIDVQ